MPNRRARRNRGGAAGLTLVEVALVLVLLVTLAGLAWPAVDSAFSYARLRTAGDQLRVAWSQARIAAMRSGHVHAFRYELDGSSWRVEVRDGRPSQSRPALSAAATPQPAVLAADALDAQRLVGESRFPRQQQQSSLAQGGFSAPILFRPDGTTSDATIELRNDRGATVRVVLRGLTGVARVLEEDDYPSRSP